ncbi:PAS domain-containing protein [Schlesneria sp. T3-172]|uniref:PAS domain-containing hybrid sensor histidine kinase/response regulator n=1 Tax=Schlesneria sphaerica TaxID=3373610 RepID=UPI0037CA3FBF
MQPNSPKDTVSVSNTNLKLDALQRSEERYRALVNTIAQVVWSWTPDGEDSGFAQSRSWWEEVTGQSVEEQRASRDAWLRVVHPADRDRAAEAWANAVAANSTYDSTFRIQDQSGQWRFIRARGVPIRDSAGAVWEWVGTLEDVTIQRNAIAERERLLAVAESERRRLEEVFQHAPSLMAVLRGPDHTFERVNDQCMGIIGGRDILGKSVREAFPEVHGQGYFEILDQVYRTGQPCARANSRLSLQSDGEIQNRELHFVFQPTFDTGGNVTGVIVQGIDLTEQRRAEANLAKLTTESEWQRKVYETVLSHTADFVYLFDLQGRFTYVNRPLLELWGITLSEAVGCNFHDLNYPRDLAEKLQSQIEAVIRTGESLKDETLYTSPSGATGCYEYIFVPVLGEDGSVKAVAGSTRDVSERKRAEERLRASEQRYRALVNATSDVLYSMTGDWSEMQPIDGRGFLASSDRPVKQWMAQIVPDFEHERLQANIKQAILNKTTFELEHQVILVDGTLGWTFSRAVPILSSVGAIMEWFGTASDITRRKRAEFALNDIRSRMEAALKAGAIGTWSWDIPADRVFGDISLARMFSVGPEVINGEPLADLVNSIHPQDRERVSQAIVEAVREGNPYEADYRLRRPDGSWRWVTARGQVERNEAGEAMRLPGVVIDVTDWKRAEERLARVTEESERRKRLYEGILSSTPDLAYVFDLQHRFTYANESLLKLWGKTWDEAIGKTCLQVGFEPEHAAMHDREIEEVKRSRTTIRGVVPFEGVYGRRMYEYIFVPVIGTKGEVEAVAGTTRDVTERMESEAALREADRKKDDFLALLAHELRNPLAPIRNGLQVMRLAEGKPEIVSQAREMMDRQLSHMIRLVDDLLDISRITRNKMELRRSRVSLKEIISHAVEASMPAIHESEHQLIVQDLGESVMLEADLTRLAQVLSNLLLNSAKYTPRGGTIWLTAEQSDNEAIISVRDTGIGIPAAALPTIFDMFSQVDRSVERNMGGLGIGLALVRGFVEMHGGRVTAESAEGSGSTFTVHLPKVTENSARNAMTDASAGSGRTRRRILVVDDNQDGAQSMAMMLRIMGDDVEVAHDGIEAVAKAEQFSPDVILMDIGLPRMNGLDATRKIREADWGKSIRIFALTGWGQESDREQSRQAGCNGHLVKPVNLTDLEKLL